MAGKSKHDSLRPSAIALAVGLIFNGLALAGLPTGPQVVSGSAQVGTVGNTMSVTNSPNAIINWQSFSIGQSEAVKFIQQSASSSVLNRVVGGQLSEIMGRLTSNGQVFLINPAGILVGAGAVVDTASFFASTLQILDQDFLAGKLKFQGDADSGKITNQGWIRTGFGGHVVLMAPKIENSGIIEAPGGQILLAAGQKITLTSLDLDGLSFEVQAPTDSVLNLGQLLADGGVVKVFAGSLKHSGDIRANSLTRDAAGEIVLKAQGDVELTAGSSTVADGRSGGVIRIESETGTVRVAGNVSATGSSSAGGAIDVLGEKVVLTGNASLDVSGASGGGVMRVGGDWQGANPDVHNAQSAFVGSGVNLKADATDQGDGGKIVVWSDGNTRYLGSLSAQGGANGGNGGKAEVSGKGDLLFIGGVNLGAPKGRAGNLLLDPLDLFIDTVGGLNPFIIDESTDFPANAVTVSPATLAAIIGNVTLYASRDMRMNSAITLAAAGQGLSANAGRDLQIGAAITTNGGAVSLAAGRNLTTFAASPISTSGGSVSLSAQSISAGAMTVAAGTGAVNAAASAGGLALGTISSSGSVALASGGGALSLSNLTSTGSVALSSSSSISANSIATGGGALSANAAGSFLSFSAIDTRLGGGPTGGAVTLNSTPSSANTGNIQAGNAGVVLSGTSVSTSTITTTGSVGLTATSGNINSTIDNSASVTATANRSLSSTSINLSSNTTLNATSVSATATNCSNPSSCPAATINLTGAQGVNVGTVTANAPATTTSTTTPQFQSRNRSVNINGGNGSILAMSPASQITATDVTLRTNQGSGGGIGSAATALNVDVERSFIFRPNGEFNVLLNGSGPNNLAMELGVAATGLSYTGTLTKAGQIALNASATDTTVTAGNFAIASGFDTPVFGTTPSISLVVPNGSLIATNVVMPKGDQVGFASNIFTNPSIRGLPVTLRASDDLTVTSYTRDASGTQGKLTTLVADNGTLTLGTIAANRDTVSANGETGITVGSLSTAGNVDLTSVNGSVGAMSDGPGVEITAAGTISISANRIGSSGYGNPLDLAGGAINLSTNGAGSYIGSSATATNPVTAATTSLNIDAAGVFNVDTLSANLSNLTVTASPSGVGAGGTARVSSNGTDYDFASTGANFTLANWTAPAAQFAGGTLSFTSTAGNVALNNIDFSASNGSLSVRVDQPATGAISQTGNFDLGSGFLSLQADGPVTLGTPTLGGLSANNANSSFGTGCGVGGNYLCGVGSFTSGTLTDPTGYGSFDVTSRGAISTGNLPVGNVSFTAYSGGISTGSIGTAGSPANSVYLSTGLYYGLGGAVQTGAIEAWSTTLQADSNVVAGAINAANPNAGYVYIYTQNGNITTAAIDANSVQLDANGASAISVGDINANAAATFPSNIQINANTSVATGTLDADQISIGGHCCTTYPLITTGAIGGNRAGNYLDFSGSSIAVGGALNLDTAGTGQTLRLGALGDINITGNVITGQGGDQFNPLSLDAGNLLTINGGNGVVSTADGSFLRLHAGNTDTATPFAFARIDGGIDINGVSNSNVLIDAPAGILQTGVGANDGITAGIVTLKANSASSVIERVGNTKLQLHETTDLTIETNGDMSVLLSGASGARDLTNLDLTRGKNDATFVLDDGTANQLSANQTLSVVDNGGGVNLGLAVAGAGTALNFRYRNTDSAGNIVGLGISTKGGAAQLESVSGGITTGNINTTDGSGNDGQIYLSANTGINVSGTVNAGSSSIDFISGGNVNGGGSLLASSLIGTSVFGDVGSLGTPLAISAGSVSLHAVRNLGPGTGGDIFANLTGTSGLILDADHGFTVVGTDTALTSLAITTRGDQAGATSLSAPGQVFGFVRNGSRVDIGTVSSPTPLSSLSLNVTAGDIRVAGTGVSSVAADTFSLYADGNLFLDGTGPRLVLSNATQDFAAKNNVALTGKATITAAGNQTFRSGQAGVGDTVLQAQAGSLIVNGQDQSFSASRDVKFLGGASNGDSIAVAATGSQSIYSGRHIDFTGGSGDLSSVSVSLNGNGSQSISTSGGGNLSLTAGTGDHASVTVASNGAGNQYLYADGNFILSGGGVLGAAADASVAVIKAGSNNQNLDAGGSFILTGGAGDRGSVQIANTGSGQQILGDSYCCSNPTDNLTLQGGAGTDSFALITAVGRQQIEPTGALNMLGGSGTGAYARINTDSTISSSTSISGGPQIIGYDFAFDCCSGSQIQTIALTAGNGSGAYAEIASAGSQRIAASTSMTLTGSATDGVFARVTALSQDIRTGATTLSAGTGNAANASIEATGTEANRPSGSAYLQLLDPAALSLTAGGSALANTATARIVSGGSQRITSSPTTLTAGVGPNSKAEITAAGLQDFSLGNLTLSAGAGDGASASISAGTTQNISAGTTTLTGGGARGADAFIAAVSGQTFSAGNTSVTGGTGTAAGDARAYIANSSGAQSLNVGNLTVKSGADYGAATISNQGSAQNISAGAITVSTSVGANNGGAVFASIDNLGGGAQTINASSVNINNTNAPGTLRIHSAGAQTVTTSGAITVQTASAGDAQLDSGATQAITASNGSLTIQAAGGSGSARVTAPGAQTIVTRFVDVSTAAAATGNAQLSAGGDQAIHTTNGSASANGSLRIAALGSGTAQVISGGNQLLEIDYPEQMQSAGRDGRITVGNGAALGNSLLAAVNQDVFARSITVLGGAVAGANAKIDVSGVQNVSLVSSSISAAPAAGITVTGGAGGSALIDPVTQTILSNGTISVSGGNGLNTVGGIIGTGDQTVLVTSGGVSSIDVSGGNGNNAFGLIITSGSIQRIGTSGGFVLNAGTGTNSDAIIGANGGTAESFIACGTGTCNFPGIPSGNNPFINSTTDVGVYYNPIVVPLSEIIAATGGAPSSGFDLPFDLTSLLLWNPTLSMSEDDSDILFGRRLPVCR